MTAELLRRKPERDYTGVDISERALSFARAFNPNVDFHVHNLSEGPAGKQYDICVSVEVIEHIPPELVGAYVEHVAGSLVAGGQFVLTTPTTNQPTHRKHYQHFTLDALREHLEPHFIIDHVEYLNVENRLANILGRLLANKYFLITNIRVRNTLYALYKKHCFRGKKTTGTRILIRATKA
jgi:cyclopropane fatty-acyl-phospholipid synthase-like methyltransferase